MEIGKLFLKYTNNTFSIYLQPVCFNFTQHLTFPIMQKLHLNFLTFPFLYPNNHYFIFLYFKTSAEEIMKCQKEVSLNGFLSLVDLLPFTSSSNTLCSPTQFSIPCCLLIMLFLFLCIFLFSSSLYNMYKFIYLQTACIFFTY